MYEYALRLGTEMHSNDQRLRLQRLVQKSLKQTALLGRQLTHAHAHTRTHNKANVYLTCLNAFRLVDPKFAWISKADLSPFWNEENVRHSLF